MQDDFYAVIYSCERMILISKTGHNSMAAGMVMILNPTDACLAIGSVFLIFIQENQLEKMSPAMA